MATTPKDQFSKKESQERFEAALRAGLKTPAKPHSEMKLGKVKREPGKPDSRPSSRQKINKNRSGPKAGG